MKSEGNEPSQQVDRLEQVKSPQPIESLEAAFEASTDALIQAITNLRRENANLRDQRASLLAERASLVEKSEQARTRVEAMIARLKTMEIGA